MNQPVGNGGEVGAKTRITLTPGQLFTLIAAAIAVAAWCWNTTGKVDAVTKDVTEIKAVQSEMLERLNAVDPVPEPPRRRRRGV